MKKVLTVILVLVISGAAFAHMDDDKALYLAGKDQCTAGQWVSAVKQFDQLIADYPKSSFRDAAMFWKGYCLEKSGQQERAFETYQLLNENYPESTWRDDALQKQLGLSSMLATSGSGKYFQFILKCSDSNSYNLRFQAGVILAKLGHKKAIPVLEEYRNDENFGETAITYINLLSSEEKAKSKLEQMMQGKEFFPNRKITYDDKPRLVRKSDFQYEQMLKKGTWSWMELIAFGLWHVVPEKKFNEFWAIVNASERDAWLKKFWNENDPDPETEQNEFKDEFLRRVKYARTNFSEVYDPEKHGEMMRSYLKSAYLLNGQKNAPWDARGELYIKYGQPDLRREELIKKRRNENWLYYSHGVDFVVRVFRTNIYKDAIEPGEMSRSNYRFGKVNRQIPSRNRFDRSGSDKGSREIDFRFNFIESPKYFSNPNSGQGFTIGKMSIAEYPDAEQNIQIGYQFKPEVYNLENYYGPFYGSISTFYKIYDEGGKIVAQGAREKTEVLLPGRTNQIMEVVSVHLAPGKYTFAGKVVDHNLKKSAEINKTFTVESAGEVE